MALSLASALAVGQALPAFPAHAASISEPAACQVQSDAELRAAIEAITLRSLEKGLTGLDYSALVADQWRKGSLDQVIDKQVDAAIGQIKDEESWTELLRSLTSKEKAQDLAMAVAERVYRSEGFKTALEQAALDIGRDVAKRIEIASMDAGEPAAQCMRAFLGPRYGRTVSRLVGDDTRKEFEVDGKAQSADISSGQILAGNKDALAGAAILIVRRQLSRIAQRIGTRIVGSVLSRVVSVAAGGVGLVLIAKDIWDFRHGVLPIIASEMKSRASKDKVQSEIATAMKEQIGEHTREIAQRTAERILDVWHEFRRTHAKVLEMSDRHAEFKAFLDQLGPSDMPRLTQLVSVALPGEGEAGILKRVSDGSLAEAVTRWPEEAVDIARDKSSLVEAGKWTVLAGADLPKVALHSIHRRASPDGFTKAGLARVIALDDRLAISRLVALPADARLVLLELDSSDLKNLARVLDESQLASLSGYLGGLKKEGAQRVLQAVSRNPHKMQTLGRAYVRNAVLASADQSAAIDIALRSAGPFDLTALPDDVRLVLDGRVSPILMWERHPVAVVIAGFIGLVILRWMWRILTWRPGRRRAAARGA